MRDIGLAVLLAAFFMLGGCGGPPSPDTDAFLEDSAITLEESASESALSSMIENCFPLPASSLQGGDFTIALMDSVRSKQAPVPRNASERIVFSLLYETLVKVGCDGSIMPGLADNWACTDDGTTWVFSIRPNAVLWDGTRITASLVKKAWIRNQKIPPAGDHVSPWAWLNASSKSVKVMDGQRLAIQLPEAQNDFPLLLAHPATAVAISRSGWHWPLGSGPGRLQASTPDPIPDVNVTPNRHHPAHSPWKNLRFLVKPGLDPRDFIVQDPDILVVGNNTTADFFRDAPGFQVTALPWQRLYLLVCSPRHNPHGSSRWIKPIANLNPAADLTGVASRPWEHLVYPVTKALTCPQLTGPIHKTVAQPDNRTSSLWLDENTLLFCSEDFGSRELAMRLAALGAASTKAQGTSLVQLNSALELQSPGAFILAVGRHYPSGCLQLASLLGRATWLQKAASANMYGDVAKSVLGDPPIACALKQTGIITPLLVTHPYLVHKNNIAGIKLEFDGTVNLSELGRTP